MKLITTLGAWSYPLIFLGAMLESAAFLGVFVPGESMVLLAGFLSSYKVLNIGILVAVVTAGAILGDNIGYELGRYLGRPWLVKHGKRFGISAERIERSEQFFFRHGGKAVFLGRFVGFARALVPFIAGSTLMAYRRFLVYNALGALLWAIVFLTLGFVLGANWYLVEQWSSRVSLIVGAVLVAVIAVAWFRSRKTSSHG